MAVLALSVAPSAAKVLLQGQPCKSAGKVLVRGGQRHVCTMVARKLTWKLSPVSTTKQRPVTVVPSPPSASSKVTEPARPPGPTGFSDLVQRYEGISYAAWASARKTILDSSKSVPEYLLVLGPNSSLALNNLETAALLVSRLHPDAKRPTELNVLAFNYQDRDWATTQMDRLMPSAGSSWINFTACATRERCWGGGAFSDRSGRILMVLTTDFDDENHRSGTFDAHEFTHVIQLTALGAETTWPRPNSWPPSWLWEGHANFSQYASVYHTSFDQYQNKIHGSARELMRLKIAEPDFLIEFFQPVTSTTWLERYPSWWQYELGAHFVEVLASLKGPAGLLELWIRMGDGMSFKPAFEKTYGLSFDEALPIVAEAISKKIQAQAS